MPSIDTADLKMVMESEEDFVLVNTLPKENFEETKIPGAVNIPQESEDFVERVEQQAGNKDKRIVVYCASVECDSSTDAAKKLDDAGFTNVYDYRVGARGWHHKEEESSNERKPQAAAKPARR